MVHAPQLLITLTKGHLTLMKQNFSSREGHGTLNRDLFVGYISNYNPCLLVYVMYGECGDLQ